MVRAPISPATAADLWRTAHALADVARPVTLASFRQPDLQADNKDANGFDPVTVADRAAEAAMRDTLARLRPQDAVLGEEAGATPGTSGLTWVLDPIDGTRAYLSGTPTWGVLIGLADAQGPILGIVDQPFIGERFCGGLGTAHVTGPQGKQRLATRPARALSQSVVFTTFPEIGTHAERQAFERVSAQARLTRYGMDCYAYALLASGQIDLVIEAGLHSYDVMAPIAVIEAAGGIVTNWQGGPAHHGGQVIAAANASVHAEALAFLAR
ncbi:histidinol-phosphatase [Pararhodobacter sp.]|uniref:histidinol-phosphatase n=1 Tax=Pararhodobacter sp. TaxID=2127056 RepID=UPI002AFF2AB2|nr:histidinol-phosphatase [Pararhodobacter sp.]